MDNMADTDWWLEEQMDKLKGEWEDSPPIHLYEWIQSAYPEVFKQWLSIYDIERN
jgi:hypothetical protein